MEIIKLVTYNLKFEVNLDTFYPTSKDRCIKVMDVMSLNPDNEAFMFTGEELIIHCIDAAIHNMEIGKLALSKQYYKNAKYTLDYLKNHTDTTKSIPDWLDIVALSSDPLIREKEGLPV